MLKVGWVTKQCVDAIVKFLCSATAKTYFNCVIVITINICDKDIKTINKYYVYVALFLPKFVIEKLNKLKK
jgi:hypothetical protein